MKQIIIIFFLGIIYPYHLFGQKIHNSKLKIKDRIAYYSGIRYTGQTFKKDGKRMIIYTYKDGRLDGPLLNGYEKIIYKNGLITEYFLRDQNKETIFYLEDKNFKKKIFSIKLGARFIDEKDKTLIVKSKNNKTKLISGLFIEGLNNYNDFIALESFNIHYAEIAGYGPGLDQSTEIKTNQVFNSFLYKLTNVGIYKLVLIRNGEKFLAKAQYSIKIIH